MSDDTEEGPPEITGPAERPYAPGSIPSMLAALEIPEKTLQRWGRGVLLAYWRATDGLTIDELLVALKSTNKRRSANPARTWLRRAQVLRPRKPVEMRPPILPGGRRQGVWEMIPGAKYVQPPRMSTAAQLRRALADIRELHKPSDEQLVLSFAQICGECKRPTPCETWEIAETALNPPEPT